MCWTFGTLCSIDIYKGEIIHLFTIIIIIFAAVIISYKIVCNKKVTINAKSPMPIYITMEILLIGNTVLTLRTIIGHLDKIVNEIGRVAIILPIISVIGLLIMLSWLLYKIVYKKKLLKNKIIMLLPLIIGIILFSISIYIISKNINKDYASEYEKYVQEKYK